MDQPLRVWVDLETSSIILTVLDEDNQMIYVAFEYVDAAREGMVINCLDSVKILTKLKQRAERILGGKLVIMCGAIPPERVMAVPT